MFRFFRTKRAAASQAAPPSFIQVPADGNIWRRIEGKNSDLTDKLLHARLAETITWCDSLVSPSELRSNALRPRLFHDGQADLVCDLGRNRQHELRHKGLLVNHRSPIIATGRFMLYFPDENLADGYAEVVSGGFFDVDNLPAYDTWVSLVSEDAHPRMSARRYLLCYVPALLVEAAEAGIDGNPEQCIVWLDRSDASICRRVAALTSIDPMLQGLSTIADPQSFD